MFIYYGHHKCASLWFNLIFNEYCKKLNLKYVAIGPENLPQNKRDTFKVNKFYLNYDFLTIGNANINHNILFPDIKGVHIFRDPREFIISAYFSHKYTHPLTNHWPELKKHRKVLLSLSIEEGLIQTIKFCNMFLNDMDSWSLKEKDILQIKMESLNNNLILDILKFSKLPMNENLMLDILNQYDIKKLKLNKIKLKNVNNEHFRSNQLKWDDLKTIKIEKLFYDKWYNLIKKLGYE